jgi:hypothetical protein
MAFDGLDVDTGGDHGPLPTRFDDHEPGRALLALQSAPVPGEHNQRRFVIAMVQTNANHRNATLRNLAHRNSRDGSLGLFERNGRAYRAVVDHDRMEHRALTDALKAVVEALVRPGWAWADLGCATEPSVGLGLEGWDG